MSRKLRAGVSGLMAVLASSAMLVKASHAQVVVGEVLEQATAEPLRGVFVALLDPAGERVTGVLTDERGRFTLRAPAPGRYSLRADRIGYETEYSRPLDVAAVTSYRFQLSSRAVELGGLVVEAETRECRLRPEEGTRLQELWDQVRIAAEVAVWTEESGFLRFDGLQYDRQLDPLTLGVRDERVRPGRVVGERPFGVLPADDLVAEGFIRFEDESYVFHGLDAGTILSDAFLDNHCFRIAAPEPDREGLIGLSFDPARERSVPGVRGVLWLDEETSELRSLEYVYTQVPWGLPPDAFGGDAEFRRLPSGAWIVERWSIRMPRLERVPADMPIILLRRPRDVMARLSEQAGLAIRENAGELVAIYTGDGVRLPMPERAALAGAVYDSIAGGPLVNARILLAGTEYETLTNDLGEFRLDDLPDGVYTLTFEHAVLDSLGIDPPTAEVALERGDLTVRDMAIPGPATVFAVACPEPAAPGAGRPVVGRVVDARTGMPVSGASVVLHHLGDAEMVSDPDAGIATTTDGHGVFRFCEVPASGNAVLVADFLGHVWTEAMHALSETEPVYQELALRLDLPARISGQVVNADTGEPLRGVSVHLEGTELAQVTGSAGRFLFPEVPAGEHVLRVEHVRFLPVSDTVRVDGTGRTFELAVQLGSQAIPLSPVTVRAAARPRTGIMGAVYDRIDRVRFSGGGTVFDRHDIERRNPARLTHLIAQARGVRIERLVAPQATPGRTVQIIVSDRAWMPGRGTYVDDDGSREDYLAYESCPMAIYLDGIMVQSGGQNFDPTDGDIDAIATVTNVEAVEVYHPSERIPPEVSGSHASCGVVLVWTRRDV